MQRALSLDQSPPLSAALRYFVVVPVFAFLAGALLLWEGQLALLTRWSGTTLALTHLFTLGALGMAMIGALLQLLPVVAAARIPHPRRLATGVHALLCAGVLALSGAFLLSKPLLFQAALALLLPALLWFAGAVTVGLWQRHPDGASAMVGTVRLALAALLVTITLAAIVAAAFAWPGTAPLLPLLLATDLHAMWGLFGWGALLVTGVAFQVVPMFQVTPVYPERFARSVGVLLFLLLVAVSISAALAGALPDAAIGLVLAGYAVFAAFTLALLAKRARPEADAMTLFWRLAMLCLIACPLAWLAPPSLAPGVLVVAGFLYSTVNGMLYKIVPFLVWHHLAATAAPGQRPPSVKHIIPDRHAQRQFWLHGAALLLLLAACWLPEWLARPAGAAMCASSSLLMINLLRALRLCRDASAIDLAAAPAK